jgi:hypothetical protein
VYEPIALLDLVLPSLQLEPLPASQHVGQVVSELNDILASTELLISMLAQVIGLSREDPPIFLPCLAAFQCRIFCWLCGVLSRAGVEITGACPVNFSILETLSTSYLMP